MLAAVFAAGGSRVIHVALVEDNPDLREEVVFHLSRHGHAVTGLPDGAALDAHLTRSPVDVLILDLGLPGEDGIEIAGRLRRSRPAIAIAMLTARGQIEDRLLGLKTGADIYLVKPVDMRELSAVVESLYRRVHRGPPASPAAGAAPVWRLDAYTMELTSPTQESMMLTPTEFNLLRELAGAAPEPVTRVRLAEAIGHPEPDFDYRRLETAMSRLRRKIESCCSDGGALRSARNVGYVFAGAIELGKGPRDAPQARDRSE
jgi:DNA-binding response OmpR family regulator